MSAEAGNRDCVFCRIIRGEIPSNIIYRDAEVVAFPDINPVTPVHILIVPVKHIPSLAELSDADSPLVGRMVRVANELARRQGIAPKGYRLTINSGADAGQIVYHLHMHLMGGRHLEWKH
ncbi:MAG: histidine triad nucleotide-binding protein [Dehalococcoidales bacterium]|nr:histidine triad nucleotide-binding protein [Dehalococcoidales bacterium]